MTVACADEKTMRIALVLREATVLDEPHWEAFVKATGATGEKSLGQVLKSDVSLRTFYELFTIDVVTLKTKAERPDALELAKALSAPVSITASEVAHILKQNQPDVARLCHALISLSLMNTEDLEKALDLAEKNALNVYDVLVAQRLVTPEVVKQATTEKVPEFALDNRILLAGDILIYNNLIAKDDLTRALESRSVTRAPLAATLAQLGILTQEDLFAALQRGLELPLVEILAYDVPSDLAARFPAEFMRRQLFVPLSLQDRHWEIGTADPFNLALADTITLLTGRRVSMIYTPHQDLLTKLEALFPQAGASAGDALSAMPAATAPRAARPVRPAETAKPKAVFADTGVRASGVDVRPAGQPEPFVDNLSTVQLVTQIIESALDARATDIHIEPQLEFVRVRYRVDGQLHSIMRVPAEMMLSITSRIKVIAGMNVTERRRPQDGHFSFETKTGSYDFRISTMPSAYGEKIVMRVLDSSRVMTGLPELGLEEEQLTTLDRLLRRPYGLILVTGPTGSGKTSTLYAALCTVNTDSVNIITIEDPVEYMLPGIAQVQVDAAADLTFAGGLRAALRQDPDIIMVGEIRDVDTARTAVRASMTGHLVLSTLHTNTAVGAISALTQMGIEPFVLSAAVSGIVAQRLVRVIDPEHKVPYKPPKAVLQALGLPENTRRKFFRGEPAQTNMGTGFRGRTGIFEVVEMTAPLRKAVIENAGEQRMQELAAERSKTLFQSAMEKVYKGITTPEEVLRAVVTEA
jgi:type IV pilus assembly protein PilB